MIVGTLFSFLYFDFIVVQFSPWYDPRYFIPIAGMLIGNSMTGITLGVSALLEGFRSRKKEIEAALMLGATPSKASKRMVNNAFDSAILPTINNMVGMGIVFFTWNDDRGHFIWGKPVRCDQIPDCDNARYYR